MTLPAPARALVAIIRKHRLNYAKFTKAAHQARKHLKMKPLSGARKLPKLLTEAELRRFYETIDRADDLKHSILLRLLFYTAVRVSELCAMKIADVDLAAGKIFIDQGKGSKDRYVLFPQGFGLTLKAYLAGVPDNEYLFESNQRRRFSDSRIRQIVREYADAAGLVGVHPHLLRHQMLSFLTAQKLSDSQIQLISGHASKKSLERYQHISLEQTQGDYQDAVRRLGI
jgi:integrase